MDDEYEDFSVSTPFEALVADIQEVQAIRLQLPLVSRTLVSFTPSDAGASQMAAASKLSLR